jgi:hypothetical protein
MAVFCLKIADYFAVSSGLLSPKDISVSFVWVKTCKHYQAFCSNESLATEHLADFLF